MATWIIPLLLAGIFVGIPFMTVMRMLSQLPKPRVLCHKRWSQTTNSGVVATVGFYVTLFIRDSYYVGDHTPVQIGAGFLIAALVYTFGLVLILRQYSGLYPEYLVTTGRTGLGLRKVAYRRIQNVERLSQGQGETRLLLETNDGSAFPFTLPAGSVSMLDECIRAGNRGL